VRWSPAPVLEVLGGIQRRPYPLGGIGDYRDPHILFETEQAALLMRRYEDPSARVAKELSAEAMSTWRDADNNLRLVAEPDWDEWVRATYEVYREVAPHMEMRDMPYWKHVREVAAKSEAPARVKDAIGLLDGMLAKDPDAILAILDRHMDDESFAIPKSLMTVAGVVALELRMASAEERRAFVDRNMMKLHPGNENEDVAYRVIRSYAARE
jgi:hypothetical protein